MRSRGASIRSPDKMHFLDTHGEQSKVHSSRPLIFAIVGTWFVSNVSLGSVTKWTYLYGELCPASGAPCRAYKFPFAVTAMHMLFSWLVCLILIWRREQTLIRLDMQAQLKKIAPLAAIFSVCIAMGNLSLKYIFPSFNQMLSSVSPLVTVLVSVFLRGKRYNYWTWASMPVICGGLLLCGGQEVNYDSLGVALVVGATILRALKSVMQEKLLDPKERYLDSVTLTYYMAPWAGSFLVMMSLAFEGVEPLAMLLTAPGLGVGETDVWSDQADAPTSAGTDMGKLRRDSGLGALLALLAMSGLNACLVNISGNMVTAHLGAVALQILGNVKSCLAIVVSAAIFQNPVAPAQAAGVVVCLLGVWVYQRKGGPAVVAPS